MNYSWQRQCVLTIMQESHTHMTAQQVYELASLRIPRISLGTVYRNLNTLVEVGAIGRVSVPGFADRFDWDPDHHCHGFCSKCHKLINLQLPADALEQLVHKSCAAAESYDLIITGLCDECRSSEK